MRVTLTQEQAECLGIVVCRCGHRPNNHFYAGDSPVHCAFCDCKKYRQVICLPKAELIRGPQERNH